LRIFEISTCGGKNLFSLDIYNNSALRFLPLHYHGKIGFTTVTMVVGLAGLLDNVIKLSGR